MTQHGYESLQDTQQQTEETPPEPTQTQASTESVSDPVAPPGNWKDYFSPQYHDWDRFRQAKTPDDLMESLGYFMNKAGHSLPLPKGDASVEDTEAFYQDVMSRVPGLTRVPQEEDSDSIKQAFRKQMGVPEDAKGYQLPDFKDLHREPGVEVAQDKLDSLRDMAHRAGLSQQAFTDFMKEFVATDVDSRNATQREFITEVNGLVKEWGTQFEANVDSASRLAKQLFPNMGESLVKQIEAGELSAGWLRDLTSLSSRLAPEEMQLVGPLGSSPGLTRDAIRSRVDELTVKIQKEDLTHDQKQRLIDERLQLLDRLSS